MECVESANRNMQKIRKISTNGSPAVHTVYALSYSDFDVGISDDKFKNINTRLDSPTLSRVSIR